MTTGRINQVTILSNPPKWITLAKHSEVSSERSYQTSLESEAVVRDET